MYSDSEDEVFFGPLTMREIKIGFGVIDKKNMSTSKNNERRKMESDRNSIIEISSEENSFVDLDDKENTNPIPSLKNVFISNNFENAIKESKLEDTFKSKFNECSSSTVSTNSDDTKSITSSFLDKLVACISEGNENLFENIHLTEKRNVQASPCLSRIEEISSFNPNNSNISNKDNETYDLIIDLSNSKSENEIQEQESLKKEDNGHFISSIANVEVVFKELEQISPINNSVSKTDEIISDTNNESKHFISSINHDQEFSEKLYDCISSIHNDGGISEKYENCISLIHHDDGVSEKYENCFISLNNGEAVSEKYESCISPRNNDEIVVEKCISPRNNDEIVSEKCISPIKNDEMVLEKRISPINNDNLVSKKCISPINDGLVSEKCISPINNDEIVSEKCISPINNDEMVLEKRISPINNDEMVSEKYSPINDNEKNISRIKNVEEISEINIENLAIVPDKSENCSLSNNNCKRISENLETDNKSEYLENMKINEMENVSYEDDFEDIDSNDSSKIEDINEIEISKILDEDDSLNEINNTFSECTLNSTNENQENGTNTERMHEILEPNKENGEGTYKIQRNEHESVTNIYAGYSELKMYNRIEAVDKIENIFFENRPESELDIEQIVELQERESNSEDPNNENDIPRHYNIETNDTLDKFLENKIQNENDSFLNESSTSSLGCEEFNSSIEEPNRFPSLNRKLDSIEHVHPKQNRQNIDDDWKQANSPIRESKQVSLLENPIEHVNLKSYHQNDIDNHWKQVGSPIGKLDKVQSVNLKFSKSPIGHVHRKPHNSPIGELKEIQLANRKFSSSPIQHAHRKPHNSTQLNSPIGESKEVQSENRSPIEHVHRKPHRQTEIIDNNWKQALSLSNDTLIAEQSMLPTSVTLLEKTNIDYNLNSPENNKVFKPSTIPTILEKPEQSVDLTCSENESMLSESNGVNVSYSTACEDSEAECNNTLDMIDRLLRMEAASNATTVQSTEKPKKVEHISPRKPKLDPPTNSNIRSLSKLRTPKAVAQPLGNFKPIINSPLKTTPKKPVSSTPSRLELQKGNINKIQPSQSKISPLVKNASAPRIGFVARTPSSATKNVSTKTNVNSPKMIKSSKEPISKPSKTVPTKLNVNSPKLISPLVKNTKTPPSATKTTSVDSPITAEVNELTESFDQGKAESSFVQLRSTLRRQLSDLYIEPSSTEKRITPKPKMGPSVEAKKNVFKTPTFSRVLKSTEKSKMSKNIMSPVDFYINKAPQSPLVVKCDYSKRQPKFYDKEKLKNGENNEVESIGNPLPFCAYKSASNVKLVEDKTTEVPKSVRKFFPTVQYVIKHESRIKAEERKSPRLRQQTTMNNDSLNALDNSLSIFNASANANDVSVRVKKSALRTPK